MTPPSTSQAPASAPHATLADSIPALVDYLRSKGTPGESPTGSGDDPGQGVAERLQAVPQRRTKPFTVVFVTIYSVENAGIRYLSSTLKRAGYNSYCIFLRDWRHNLLEMPSDAEFAMALNLIREKEADLVGIGFMSSLYQMSKELTLRIKANFPDLPVIWGGIHPTSVPEECIQDPCDIVCIGEGEEAMLELVDRMASGQDYTDVRNMWVKKDGQLYKNPLRPLLQNLDWLPYPDIDHENKYYIEEGRLYNEEPWLRTAEYRIYFSRGCPYNCSYCYVSILRDVYDEKGKKYYRHRSVEHIIGEMEAVKSKFKRLGHVKVDDDTSFAFGQEWLDEFCDKWKQRVDVPFECLLIPPMLREDMLEQLKAAGLFRVQTGIESGSAKESKEIYNRSPGNKSIQKFGEFNKRLKLDMIYDVIIDNPWATTEMKMEMAEFLLELERPYKIYFYSLTYFPGTALTRQMISEGKISPDEVEGRSTKAWKQFRVSMDWPRSDEDRFFLGIYSLVSKNFIPKRLIRYLLDHREAWTQGWRLETLFYGAWAANLLRMVGIAWEYWRRGDLTWFKIRQYASIRKLISQ